MEHFSALLCFLHFKDKQEKRNERGPILILKFPRKKNHLHMGSPLIFDPCKLPYKPENNFQKYRNSPWMVARLAYSREVAIFRLPINKFLIRDLSPMEYLVKYCKVEERRERLYKLVSFW